MNASVKKIIFFLPFLPEEQVVETTEKNGDAKEIQSKKNKKKSKGDTTVNETGIEDQSTKASKESNGVSELAEDELNKKQKEKKKKKNKSTSELLHTDEKQVEEVPSKSLDAELPDGETAVDKKSKKRSHEASEDGINESKKASKKRKRMAANENESQPDQEVVVEESKSKKSKGLEEGKDVPQQNGDTFESDQVGSPKFSANGIDNSGQRKSANKQPKSSEVR